MRIFIFVFLVAILSSCGMFGGNQGHLRYVKADKKEVPVIDKKSNDRTQIDLVDENSNNTQNSSKELAIVEDLKPVELNKISDAQLLDQEINNTAKAENESNAKSEEDDEKIVAQALQAEKKSNASLFFSVAGLISVFIPFIGIIPFIFCLVFFSKANSSRYITQMGQNRLNATKVFIVIDTIILIAWIMLFVAIFFF